MRPFAAVQPLMRRVNNEDRWDFVGSCFRLWSPNQYITAAHCIQDAKPDQLKVFNVFPNGDFRCKNILRHPAADIAVIQIEGNVPKEYERFSITDKCDFGYPIHCFGYADDRMLTLCADNARVIGGIIQRQFVYNDGTYISPAFELSAPIPKGTSGGPAFLADDPQFAIGVAIASIQSQIVVSQLEYHEENGHCEKETISEITRYGVILNFGAKNIKAWLEDNLGGGKNNV